MDSANGRAHDKLLTFALGGRALRRFVLSRLLCEQRQEYARSDERQQDDDR
ncbi:hypothetical protein D3C84_1260170 [compost metagenome]